MGQNEPPAVGVDYEAMVRRFNVHDPEIQLHALDLFAYMRQTCPVAHSEAFGGFRALSRYQDIYDAAHLPEQLSSFPVTIPAFGNPVPMIPIEADPPMHAKYRRIAGTFFTESAIHKLEPKIREIVAGLLDGIEGQSEVDLVTEVAVPLPLKVILDLYLQIPEEDHKMLYEKFVVMLQPDPNQSEEEKLETSMGLGLETMIYFARLLDERRQSLEGDDLISGLARADFDGVVLDEEELLGFCLLLVPAGFDTTASAISRTFLLLAERPDILATLRADSSLIPLAVEELLRYISPVPELCRTVTEPVTVAGHEFQTGDRVALLWPSANRDEVEFPKPDDFIIDRKPNRHLAFGSGIHRCMGSHVARAEIRILLEEWITREFPSYDLVEPPVWHTGDTWGLKSLRVAFAEVWKQRAPSRETA